MNKEYNVILVDDEDDIRGRLASLITKDSGFNIVGKASNGFDAFEMVEELDVDVVITDIRMPYVDGVELANMLKLDYPNIKVAFLTGYDEFDYAREAIELGVISYLMKPVTKEDIVAFLAKLKKQLDQEYDSLYNMEHLQQHYQMHLPLIVEHQLHNLLKMREISQTDLDEFTRYGIHLRHGNYVVGVIELADKTAFNEQMSAQMFLRNFINTSFDAFRVVIPFSTIDGLCFVLQDEALKIDTVESIFRKLFALKQYDISYQFRIGLSDVFHDFTLFPEKYLQASNALTSTRFLNSDVIVKFDDVRQRETKDVMMSMEHLKELTYTIRFGDDQAVETLFDQHIQKAKQQQTYTLNYQGYMVSLANVLLEYSVRLNLDTEDLANKHYLTKMFDFTSVIDLLEYTKETVFVFRKMNISSSINRVAEVIKDITTFVETKYQDATISLEMVADQFDLSPSYLSTLFKREKKINFNKYLIGVRIQKAKELLKYSELKIAEIAEKVGYNDVYYFSHSFKKNVGMSPKEYRKHEQI